MDNDISQQILKEVRSLRRAFQWGTAASLVVLVLVFGWAAWLIHSRRASEASPWTPIKVAMAQYDYPKALKLAQQLAVAHPNDYWSHYYLGWIYVEMGDLARGEAEYSRAYELWPSEDMQKRLEAVRKRKDSEATKTK
jgi:tetratricopeptide (TPR) repeat protein